MRRLGRVCATSLLLIGSAWGQYFGMVATSGTSFPLAVNYQSYRIVDAGFTVQWQGLHVCNSTNANCQSNPAANTSLSTSALDALLLSLYANGISDGVLYTMHRTPSWASPNPTDSVCDYGSGSCWPPVNLNSDGSGSNNIWDNWVTQVATYVNNAAYLRTHAHIKYWEPWNEAYRNPIANASFTCSGTNCSIHATFAQLLRMTEDTRCIITGSGNVHNYPSVGNTTSCSSYLAALGQSAIDRSAQIVLDSEDAENPNIDVWQNYLYCSGTGGAAPPGGSDCNWNSTTAWGSQSVDIMNFHEYLTTAQPEFFTSTLLPRIHAMLSSADQAKPLWLGEGSFGSGVGNIWTDGYSQAAYTLRENVILLGNGVSRNYWYAFNISGTLFSSGSLTLAGEAYNSIVTWIENATPVCSVTGTLNTCTFSQGGRSKELVWDSQFGPGGSFGGSYADCTTSPNPTICGNTSYSVPGTYNGDWMDFTGAIHAFSATVTVGAVPILLESPAVGGTQYYVSMTGSDSNNCTTVNTPCLTLAHAESLSASGDTINFAGGIYRLSTGSCSGTSCTGFSSTAGSTNAKANQTFTGPSCTASSAICAAHLSGGVIIGGAAVFDSGTGYYKVTGMTQAGVVNVAASCDTGWDGCLYPEDLFFDRSPYQHLSCTTTACNSGTPPTIGSGQWWFDYNNDVIWFADNPSGHTVETSVLRTAFSPNGVNGLTIENLAIEEFASQLQQGGGIDPAAGGTESSSTGINWLVQQVYATLNHGTGIRPGFGMTIQNSVSTANGNFGIAGGLPAGPTTTPSGLTVQYNTVTYNNYAHVFPSYGAGGIKFGNTAYAVIRGNIISNNIGNAVHFDVNSIWPTIDGNIIEGNTDPLNTGLGIAFEISNGGAIVRNNYIQFDGKNGSFALQSSTSQGMQAYCNVAEALSGVSQTLWQVNANNRGTITVSPNAGAQQISSGNYFHHNSYIWDAGATSNVGFRQNDPTNQPNFFSLNTSPDYNAYHVNSVLGTGTAKFVYDNNNSGSNTLVNFSTFQSRGADVHGTIDTNSTSGFPSISISSPADGSAVTSPATINAIASDASGIAKVEFYVDWALAGTVTSGPYNFSASMGTGSHVLTAMAYSNAGIRNCYAVTVTALSGVASPTGLSIFVIP